MKLAGLTLLLLLLSAPCAKAGSDTPDTEVVEGANRVATWQLANLESLDGIRTFHERTAQKRGWVRAAFYIGLERWQGVADQAAFRQALYDMAEANEWRLDDRFWHADDQAIAQVYLALEGADIGPTQEAFDEVLALDPSNSLEFTPPTEQDV